MTDRKILNLPYEIKLHWITDFPDGTKRIVYLLFPSPVSAPRIYSRKDRTDDVDNKTRSDERRWLANLATDSYNKSHVGTLAINGASLSPNIHIQIYYIYGI